MEFCSWGERPDSTSNKDKWEFIAEELGRDGEAGSG